MAVSGEVSVKAAVYGEKSAPAGHAAAHELGAVRAARRSTSGLVSCAHILTLTDDDAHVMLAATACGFSRASLH